MIALDRDLIERAREANILAVAQHYGAKLKRVGVCEFVGPCPVCAGRDRFAVNTKKKVWNCRRCGEGGDVIKFLQHVIGATFGEAIAILSGKKWTPTIPTIRCGRDDDDRSCNDNGVLAARIWRSARSVKGTLAEPYLVGASPKGRGIDIEQIVAIDDVLRFEPRCPFAGKELSCLVALVRSVVSDEPMGIVRTNLRSDWKNPERRVLGPKKNGAIKLWGDATVTAGLVIGEGLETVAAAATRVQHRQHHTLLQPAWALIDCVNLENFPVLPGIEAITILVDNDQNCCGQDAADVCTQRWLAAGRRVCQLVPNKVGTDFNDIANDIASEAFDE